MRKRKRAKHATSVRPAFATYRRWLFVAGGLILLTAVLLFFTEYESFASLYDAEYTGRAACGECHTVIYGRWQESPHANMTRHPDASSVVGNFEDGVYYLPEDAQHTELDKLPAAKMMREGDDYFMALRHPESDEYVPFKIAYVIGYQYRQTYLTDEPGGVLRRLPLQYSVEMGEFFPTGICKKAASLRWLTCGRR